MHRTFAAAAALLTMATGFGVTGSGQAASPRGSGEAGSGQTHVFSVGLWGDVPYSAEQETRLAALTQHMNAAGLAFSVFDGDLKNGTSPCDDAGYTTAIARFNAFDAPVVYVPGDNEWTDCHRTSAGGNNNLERLAHLRAVMFGSPRRFGRRTLGYEEQSAAYPENIRWTRDGIVFVGINVPGTNNNKVNTPEECARGSVRTPADCAADNAEFVARDAAVRRWVHESFEVAKAERAPGIMIVMQADPGFDRPETPNHNERLDPTMDGYTALLADLVKESRAFRGQVALVHGDTHYFQVDKPLSSTIDLVANLTRVETFGNPNVHWVKATIDPSSPNVFTFEPQIVPGN